MPLATIRKNANPNLSTIPAEIDPIMSNPNQKNAETINQKQFFILYNKKKKTQNLDRKKKAININIYPIPRASIAAPQISVLFLLSESMQT